MRERTLRERSTRGEKGTYASTGTDGGGLEREEIVEGGEVERGNSAKVFVCVDDVGKYDVFATTDEAWLTSGEGEVEERREMEGVTETGLQWRVGSERSLALIVL